MSDRESGRAAPGRVTHAGPHATQHQQHRVDDFHLPQPLEKREELAERQPGPCAGAPPAWSRRQTVPTYQRPHAPAITENHARPLVTVETVGAISHDEPVIAA